MGNFFTRVAESFKKRRADRERLKQTESMRHSIENIALVFEILNKFRNAGLLHIDFKNNNVTISNFLCQMFFYNEDEWQDFLHKLHLWTVFEFSIGAYHKAYNKAMADAEAKAFKELGALDYEQKKAVRMEAAEAFDADREIQKCPDIQFIVIGATEDNKPMLVAKLINGRYETAAVPSNQ